MGKANPISAIKDALNRTVEQNTNSGRRGLLLLSLMIGASACTPKPPEPTRTEAKATLPTPVPVSKKPLATAAESSNNEARTIRPQVYLDIYGEAKLLTPNPNISILENPISKNTRFSRKVISPSAGVEIAILEIGTDTSIDYASMIQKVFSMLPQIYTSWSPEANGKFLPGKIAFTVNKTTFSQNRNSPILFLLADFDDTSIDAFFGQRPNKKPSVALTDGKFGYAKISKSSDSSLIGINLALEPMSLAGKKLIGLKVSESESIELTVVNEMAAFFLEQHRINQPQVYLKFKTMLKDKYGYPPSNNKEYDKYLEDLSGRLKISIGEARERSIMEALTTISEWDYLSKIMNK